MAQQYGATAPPPPYEEATSPHSSNASAYADNDGYGGLSNSFSDKAVRLGFIRKVYSILCAQLVLTMSVMGFFFIDSVKKWSVQPQNQWVFWLAFVFMFVSLIAMACCPDVRRKTPHNYIFLTIFTAAEGLMLGAVTATYDVAEVMMAVGICAAITFALTIFAFQTKFDFTAMGGVLICVLLAFILFGFFAAIFGGRGRILQIVYASVGALIFSLYIVYDTQLMLGGKHKYSLSPEEYVFAALNLYLDIINLFLYILQIIGAARNN